MKYAGLIEGPEASRRFEAAMRKALSVPHAVIVARQEKLREEAAQNPNRRGPKQKIKDAASSPEIDV